MRDHESIDLDSLNAACERFLVGVLRVQLTELETLGAGDIPYAERARAYIRRYDASVESGEEGHPVPPGGRRLRLVG